MQIRQLAQGRRETRALVTNDQGRVLHIGKYFPPTPGGMERFLSDLAAAQRIAGRNVAVLVHEGPATSGIDETEYVLRCPVWFSLVFAPISPGFPFWLHRAIRRLRPDVLHLHLPNPSAFWALLLPSARRIPWVVHWHSDVEPSRYSLGLRLAYPHYRIFEYAMLDRAEAIVVTSPQYLESSRPLRPWRHKCRVIPLGVDPRRLPDIPEGGSAELWRGPGVRLLAIGRLTYYKGFDTLIEAVAGMEGVELVIVGEGDQRPAIEGHLSRLGNPRWIRLLGEVDDEACCQLLASCDIVCLPSRERTEAFGIVLMEAMRYGKPLVASNIEGSGVTWVVRNGENGLLAPIDQPMAWREVLRGLADDPERRRRMGEAGRKRFEAEMSIDRVTREVEQVYAAVRANPSLPKAVRSDPLVVIPARNEAATIGVVIDGVKERGFPGIVVVDDGSDDNTADIARAHGAWVLQAPLAQGAWGAMQTGIRFAVKQGYSGVVTMDADGQHEPACLDALLQHAETADVVIGACPERGSRMRRIAWAYFRFLTGFRFEDLTSGFRYYGADACSLLAREEATLLDYQDIGVLLLLHKAGFKIHEVPVAMNPRQIGISRVFNSWLTVVRYMFETTLLCLARWNVRVRHP